VVVTNPGQVIGCKADTPCKLSGAVSGLKPQAQMQSAVGRLADTNSVFSETWLPPALAGTLLQITSCIPALMCLWSQKEPAIYHIKWLVIIGKLTKMLKPTK